MTEANTGREPVHTDDEEITVLALASFLLRWRRIIVVFGLVGTVVGLAIGLTRTRVYVSSSTFIPQGSESAPSGLALAATQFGIRVPTSGATWGPAMYLELVNSWAVLERIALDSVVTGEGGRRESLMKLLEVDAPTAESRSDKAVRALRALITATEVTSIGGVNVTATTPWPHVSQALAERLVSEVNRFNIETHRSQGTAEREFVEVQAIEAESALLESEDSLLSFLQRNRAIVNSPELTFDRDRLQRDVVMRQQVYTSLVQMWEEAKIREVRDTPVITVLEAPRLPLVGERRRSVQKGMLGGLAGGLVGVLIALITQLVAGARRVPNEDAREFFQLVKEATPGFLRRKQQSA